MAKRGGIAARAAPFGGRPKSVSARLRGASGLDRARMGMTRPDPSVKRAVDAYVLARDNCQCTRCRRGEHEVTLTVAHKVAHARGAPYRPEYLHVLCIDCHADHEIGKESRLGGRLLRTSKNYKRSRM